MQETGETDRRAVSGDVARQKTVTALKPLKGMVMRMLQVTVESWPGGRESGKRVTSTADICRIANGALADYEARPFWSRHRECGSWARVRVSAFKPVGREPCVTRGAAKRDRR
jgi:hypothetical protein